MTPPREDAASRVARERLGRWGERRAAWFLRLKGWRILASRIRLRAGEIDLVARRGKTVAFIEVKTRSAARDLDLSIDPWRLRRVAAAAEAIAPRFARPGDAIRIDVVQIAPRRWPRHLVNVWHG